MLVCFCKNLNYKPQVINRVKYYDINGMISLFIQNLMSNEIHVISIARRVGYGYDC